MLSVAFIVGERKGKVGFSGLVQWLEVLISLLFLDEANVDDVGYRLVAIYTPVRDDGVEGQPVSASTDPIAVEPDVLKEVKQKLDLGSVKSSYSEIINTVLELLYIDGENEVDLMLQTRHLRDVIVLVIRGFAQRFNSTSLNTLLKIDL